MCKSISKSVQSGYDVSILVGDSVSESLVSTRSEAFKLVRAAELRGCSAWRITYLSDPYIQKHV